MTSHIAVVQSGYAIFGIGHTALGALRNANSNLDRDCKLKLADLEWIQPAQVDGEMYLAHITDALADQVQRIGANHFGQLSNGTLCTIAERDAEND